MRHVVLGTGGIGALLAAVLARSGGDVTILARRSDSTRPVLDVDAGRQPELDAIGGALLRRAPGDGAPATRALYASVQARLGQ